jgi:acetylornithine aminotransferase
MNSTTNIAPDLSPFPEPHLIKTFGRLPFTLTRGQGVWAWDSTGKKYIDGLAGIAVNTLGHSHPRLVSALHDQISKIIHTSNVYSSPMQEQLATKLCELSGLSKVFFCNSGLEANEAAIKIARKYGHDKGVERPEIIVFEKGFHGRSLATISASANPKIKLGFAPLLEGFVRVPFNDVAEVEKAGRENPSVVAVLLEAVQGEGGIHTAKVEFLQQLRRVCDERGWLLMFDEVQCGIGRTGKWFAHQWAGITPDVMSLAKGLGSGVPIGAVVAGPKAADVLNRGNHGTTFGGNPVAMRAGLETLAVMEDERLVENADKVGAAFRAIFKREFEGVKGVLEIRGQGMMIGIALDRECNALREIAAEAGVLLSITTDTVVRLLPPLIMTVAEAEYLAGILCPLIKEFLAKPAAAKS